MKADPPLDDTQLLNRIGYKQELKRGMREFSNFSVSFSIICILAGCLTSFHLALSTAGAGGIGLGWIVGGLFSVIVSASMAQIASAYPTAGGLYHWSTILGGRCWGWMNAWVNLLGLVFVVASVDVGVYLLARNLIFKNVLHCNTEAWGITAQISAVGLIALSQALLNHFGLRLTLKLTDFSGIFIFVVAIVLTVLMLAHARHPLQLLELFQVVNLTGASGGDVVPRSESNVMAFCLCLMLPLYTITGFDGSAHTSEETINAQSAVPKAMIGAVMWSVLVGYILVASIVLAMPDPSAAAKQGDRVVFNLLDSLPLGIWFRTLLNISIVAANFLCGLAGMMSTSRLIFAFARDGGLPKILCLIDPRTQAPTWAIWTTALLCISATLYSPAFQALAAGCAVFLYISYAMPIAACWLAERKGWRDYGPFRLGRASGIFAVLSGGGVMCVTYLGLRPPNTILRSYTVGLAALLVLIWFAFYRRRFVGPRINLGSTGKIAAREG